MSVHPPFPRLPSLNALRAFEAAARLGGFAPAAEELRVTSGAVTAQIKALEDELGAPLFQRHARGVRLTALGQRALPGFVAAFDALGLAVRDLRRDAAPRRAHVAALPAVAQLWLGPRLPALRAALPDLDLSVTAMEVPPNLKRVPFDLCLFYADTAPPGSVALASDEILPVCTPDLARQLSRPEDLRAVNCLTDTAWAEDWARWSDRAMPGGGFAPRGPVFSLYSLAVTEALNGAGVLMAHRALVAPHLASGALVAPFDLAVTLPRRLFGWTLQARRANREAARILHALSEMG
ncbi:LysR family transcriptional regulator [Paracoccus sp. M683]|uniref:LysR family transcriptional regulator n=1 Tax=Paracoccus sp. M683 TaxID=2594268 RepID=UPI00117CB8BF|nr:LysR family transcriptional regulator [Paracoccus sp. M683]TRW97776.1 LysR family transcriptional regulator [Paracoccus sp. M683]